MAVDTSGNITAFAPVALGITRAMQAAVGQQVASSGTGSTSSVTASTIPNQSVTLTTSGRPVVLVLQGQYISNINLNASFAQSADFFFFRGATELIAYQLYAAKSSIVSIPCALTFVDVVAAGTYTYTAQYAVTDTSATATAQGVTLVAYEL